MDLDINVITASVVALLGAIGTFVAIIRRRSNGNGTHKTTNGDAPATLKRVLTIVENLQREVDAKGKRIDILERKIEVLEAEITKLRAKL